MAKTRFDILSEKFWGSIEKGLMVLVDILFPFILLPDPSHIKEILHLDKPIKPDESKTFFETSVDTYFKLRFPKGIPALVGGVIKILLIPLTLAIVLGTLATIAAERAIIRPFRQWYRPTLPGVGDIIVGWRRGKYDEAARDEKLKDIGFSDKDFKALIANSWQVPNAADVIRFAVREVYEPDIAAKFGQFEGVDTVLEQGKEDMFRAGVPDETMRKYWAAHWNLPSPLQGFEMLHRGVIDNETLKLLLRALDIMPFWQDKLTAIAFQPFTRVDVRRMHKLGILDDKQIVRAYMDLGYDTEKAGAMADFTIKYNASPETSEETLSDREASKTRDLTKSDIMRGYRVGLLEKNVITSALQGLGYSKEETEYLIDREDFLAEEDRLNRSIKHLHDGYINGIYDDDTLQGLFGELGLPSKYVDNLLQVWKLERAVKVAVPSKAEVLKWLKGKLILEDQARAELTRMGYRKNYVDIYIESAIGKPKE